MKCPRCQQENPPQAKFCLECGNPRNELNYSSTGFARESDVPHAVHEAVEQHAATGDILRVICSSPTDVEAVFRLIGERAERLCGAQISIVATVHSDRIQLAAVHGVTEDAVDAVKRVFPMVCSAETVIARAARTGEIIHIPDVLADETYAHKDTARASGQRACLGVPMVADAGVVGVIFVARRATGYFGNEQVELLKTFAVEAVLAIETVRLITELHEKTLP